MLTQPSGSASGTPVAVTAEAVRNVCIVAQTSTQATVVYQTVAGSNVKGYVLDVSTNTPSPGAVTTIRANATTSGANGVGLTVLSATKLLCAYLSAGDANVKEMVLDISGTTITTNAEVNSDSTSPGPVYIYPRSVSATKSLVVFFSGNSTQLILRLQSITGSTPAPSGSSLSILALSTATYAGLGVCVMNASRAIIVRACVDGLIVYVIDISGITPVLVTSKLIRVPASSAVVHVYAAKIDSSRCYVTWRSDYSLGANSLILTIADDRVFAGETIEKLETVLQSYQYLDCDVLDSNHVVQVCRNQSSFLSAKNIEIS